MSHPAQEIKRHYLRLILTGIAFSLISLVLQTSNGVDWASLNIEKVGQGEYWRLLTGHLIHLDWHHFYMNMIGLNLCIVVFRDDVKARHWLASFVLVSIFSSLCMYYTYFNYERYLGFSDVLHGWILIGAATIAHKEPKFTAMIFLLFWAKILEENIQLPFFTSFGMSGNVAKESHIYGAIGGILYSLVFIPGFRLALKNVLKRNRANITTL